MKTKSFLSLSLLIIPFLLSYADEYSNYKNWDDEDVIGVYVEISQEEAKRNGFDESFTDYNTTRFFVKTRLDEGIYKIEVKDKLDSRFWGIAYSSLFIKFRYNPYLYNFDEGILVWDYYDGIFYKKP